MREEIVKYLIENRKMFVLNEGEAPYWMYTFGDKSNNYDENDYAVTIWFGDKDSRVEIQELIEGKHYFQGHVKSLEDLKYVLNLLKKLL